MRFYASTLCTRLILGGVLVLSFHPVEAHLLNATRVAVSLDQTTRVIEIRVEADLTRVLGSPEEYHRMATEGTAEEVESLQRRFRSGFHFQFEGEEIDLGTTGFELPALSLSEFKKTYASPMTLVQLSPEISQDFRTGVQSIPKLLIIN